MNRLLLPCAALMVLGLSVCCGPREWSSPAELWADEPAPKQPVISAFRGSEGCQACHDNPTPGFTKQGSLDLILLKESSVWMKRDQHYRAAEVLAGPLGVRMGKLLETDVTKDARCLVCHAVDRTPSTPLAKKEFDHFDTGFGVSCEGCHGPSRKWFEPHSLLTWRDKTPAEKSKLGLTDLRDPTTRALVCSSCHVGNAAEGKVVTHAMYAAGHPPLPLFEVATWSRNEPPHWVAPSAVKYLNTLKPAEAVRRYHYHAGESSEARLMTLGAVATLKQTVQTLAVEAESAAQSSSGLDLTHFDCYACHHELRIPSWRQQRGYKGTPGRPLVRPLPLAVARLACQLVAPEQAEALDTRIAALRQAFDARPFGDPTKVSVAARAMVAWTDEVLAKLQAVPFDEPTVKKLQQQLAALAAKSNGDYDQSRQLAWAYQRLATADTTETEVPAFLGELDKLLTLRLRPAKRRPLEEEMPERLQHINSFDPEAFRKAFEKLATR